MSEADEARLALLRKLAALGYQFTTPTPLTHQRILLRRRQAEACDLADVFGWSLPFRPGFLDAGLMDAMTGGGLLRAQGELLTSSVRVASLGSLLFLHSAYPARAKDAVFFGPDSYRFTDFIRAETPHLKSGATVVDIGAGAGVGGLFAAGLREPGRLVLTDVNAKALSYAAVNAAYAGIAVELREGEGLAGLSGPIDLALANPPYVAGDVGQTYAAGGGALGGELTLRWAREVIEHLAPGGRLLLYTGAAIVRGHDALHEALANLCNEIGCAMSYREIDPDVFPVLLVMPAYWGVERIAAVGGVLTKPA
ncbi:methyltransferase [Phenylobacterium sp.]|uniref:methyltransferase n=1 Tax=Phenylobacterium sp. TaxID=1871053 RepID=UPI003983CB34